MSRVRVYRLRSIRPVTADIHTLYYEPAVKFIRRDIKLNAPGIHHKPLTLSEFSHKHKVIAVTTNPDQDVVFILTRDDNLLLEWEFWLER